MERKKQWYYKKDMAYYHEGCDGQLMIGRTGYKQLPIGMGFRGDRFAVDCVRIKIVQGGCLKCHKKGIFQAKAGKKWTKYPGLNSKNKTVEVK